MIEKMIDEAKEKRESVIMRKDKSEISREKLKRR